MSPLLRWKRSASSRPTRAARCGESDATRNVRPALRDRRIQRLPSRVPWRSRKGAREQPATAARWHHSGRGWLDYRDEAPP